MKIDDKIIHYEISNQLHKSTTNSTEKIAEKQSTEKSEIEGQNQLKEDVIVDLSRTSKEVQQIKGVISSMPDVREDKVAALKEKIESGKYEIDPEVIAGKLVDDSIDELF